jgi:hypothetical protein
MSNMTEQLATVRERDGYEAMRDYAQRTLDTYRRCARPQRDGTKHFAHVDTFRPHFVISMLQLRSLLRDEPYRNLV